MNGFMEQISRNPMVDSYRWEVFMHLGYIKRDLEAKRDLLGQNIDHGVEVAKVMEKYVNNISMSARDMHREIDKIDEKYLGPGPHSMFDNM